MQSRQEVSSSHPQTPISAVPFGTPLQSKHVLVGSSHPHGPHCIGATTSSGPPTSWAKDRSILSDNDRRVSEKKNLITAIIIKCTEVNALPIRLVEGLAIIK